jgi:hypothetical protein
VLFVSFVDFFHLPKQETAIYFARSKRMSSILCLAGFRDALQGKDAAMIGI